MQETAFLARNRSDSEGTSKFLGRIVFGCIFAVLVGNWLDTRFNTTPWIMLGLLIYVLFGSIYLLIKELG